MEKKTERKETAGERSNLKKKSSQESFNMYEGQSWQPHDFQDWQENSKH